MIDKVQAITARMLNTIIAIEGLISASIGAMIVVILAKILQIPKAVPAKMVGNNYALARKQMLKVALTPNLAIKINTGMISSSLAKIIKNTAPIMEILKEETIVIFIPSF